uniref:Uncharacterized protein, isoform B n=1 Tax=Drosophila melanogaster TaxID=7227 RepID=M9PE61_DROME|nr:uncharacterized protein Dmel_CG3557, isoform B [Drosophila melanogaster]AGB92472.1 uncharacterized protein Dmel_CG3557, isoform B [Drosophila melanogaster]|eukprot:NP_001259935.1 uncharacterized protein Dmel_CG3557, isoform B [Drosophila melanogaster]
MKSCCATQTTRCECPTGLRLGKKPQAPLFDMLGPHPDEVIMTILDRILYLSGATKIIPLLELSNEAFKKESCPPPAPCAPSPCSSGSSSAYPSSSAWSTCCSKPSTICCYPKPTRCCASPKAPLVPCSPMDTPKSSCFKTASRLSSAACCPRQRTPRVDFDHPAEDIPLRNKAGSATIREQISRSISTCSVACQQLKDKLTSQIAQGHKDQKWLWTRLIRGNDGCMVYEVYKDSDVDNSPSKIGSEAPIILFLVMPNGCIMPFESICGP